MNANCGAASFVANGLDLVLVVFAKAAFELFDRIFLPIFDHLAFDTGCQVDTEFVGDGYRVAEHIGNFFGDLLQFFRIVAYRAGIVRRDPLKMFHQFTRFDRQCHAQVLRRVKLLPIAFGDEFFDHPANIRDGCLLVVHGDAKIQSLEKDEFSK